MGLYRGIARTDGGRTMTLGDVIRRRRHLLGMKQQTLAERIGQPRGQTYISAVENGTVTNIQQETLERFAAALQTTVMALLTEAGPAADQPPLELFRGLGWSDKALAEMTARWARLSDAHRAELIAMAEEVERLRQENARRAEALLHEHDSKLQPYP